MTKKTFAPGTPAGVILREWWLALKDDRGARAELRRAKSPEDVALIPAAIDLVTRLETTPIKSHGGWTERIPPIAGLAAHLDPDAEQAVLHDTTTLPARMARLQGDRPVVSQLRFRRLLRTPRAELYRSMIRILALLDHQANLYELAESMFWWGPNIQKKWAFAYFPKLPKTA